MNSKNSQITDPHRLLLKISGNIYVKKSDKILKNDAKLYVQNNSQEVYVNNIDMNNV